MDNLTIAETYYKAVGEKNMESVEKYLHPDVQFCSPMAKLNGKESVIEATKKFTNLIKSLKIRSKFTSDNQTAVIYDLECPAPIATVSTVSLMEFKGGLITKIELFYDARPFEKKKEEIFAKEN